MNAVPATCNFVSAQKNDSLTTLADFSLDITVPRDLIYRRLYMCHASNSGRDVLVRLRLMRQGQEVTRFSGRLSWSNIALVTGGIVANYDANEGRGLPYWTTHERYIESSADIVDPYPRNASAGPNVILKHFKRAVGPDNEWQGFCVCYPYEIAADIDQLKCEVSLTPRKTTDGGGATSLYSFIGCYSQNTPL